PGNRRVLYTNTLTKPFATGLKVGYGVLPAPVRRAVLRAKGNHDFGTANFLQAILARALEDGVYQNHLQRLAQTYRRKCHTLAAALGEQFPHEIPEGGLYIWTQTPNGEPTGFRSRLFQRALRAGVLYVPGELCYAEDPSRPMPRHFLRLSFGAPTLAQIREGVQRLRLALR
ncbi:MAG: PLP-dependent aminotransferase family protein, partial [Verrucomicrobiae bacterium]|nr:PLP-dependent aminotransferase family protein [Verrucomicrobiae bacterium]